VVPTLRRRRHNNNNNYFYYYDDYTIFCIKLAFRFVTGLVHEATVGVGDIDRQHIFGADVFQTFDILDAAPVVDGLDTSPSHIIRK